MRKFFLAVSLFILSGFRSTEGQPGQSLGFSLVVNGDGFTNETFFIPAPAGSYSNRYYDPKEDPGRTNLEGSTDDHYLAINIAVPIHKTAGSFTLTEDSMPDHMGFSLTCGRSGGHSISTYTPGTITVTITSYGKVGELIEGKFSGILRCNENRTITANGNFKVKRLKDRS